MSASLIVTLDRKNKTARFSGKGTFENKDKIKGLGARYDGVLKQWLLRACNLSNQELSNIFPGITIEENTEKDVEAQISSSPLSRQAPTLNFVTPEKFEPNPSIPEGVSVADFMARVRYVLASNFQRSFCIFGVILQANAAQQGRVFLELGSKEGNEERVRCVIWSNSEEICRPLREKGFELEADLEVMFEVSLQFQTRGGQVSLTIHRIVVEYTVGKLLAEREKTNERLKKEGIFSKNKSLQLPALPRRLGILTSAGGTVINDFRASLDQARFGFELYWYRVSVQGSEAKKTILAGLKALQEIPGLEAVLVFRGGGSQAELAVFNDYEIARAICLSSLPIVSAIGHQEDQCSVQDVSFCAQGVPKDIGRYFADIVMDYRRRFQACIENLLQFSEREISRSQQILSFVTQNVLGAGKQFLQARTESLERFGQAFPLFAKASWTQHLRRFLDFSSPLAVLSLRAQELAETRFHSFLGRFKDSVDFQVERSATRLQRFEQLPFESRRILEQRDLQLHSLESLIQSADPKVQLRRGFAIVRAGEDGHYIKSSKSIQSNEQIQLEFYDGVRSARVEKND